MQSVSWIQQEAFPEGHCFGCGPANNHGLRLRSYPDGGGVMATWTPEAHHVGGGGFLSGGIIGAVLDCHTGAAVWWWVHQNHGAWPANPSKPEAAGGPVYLTAGYEVRLLRPTPLQPLELFAEVVEHDEPTLIVDGCLLTGGKPRAEITARWKRFIPR